MHPKGNFLFLFAFLFLSSARCRRHLLRRTMAAWIVRGMKGMTLSCTAPGSGEERAGVDGRGRPPSHQPPSPSKQKTRFQKGRRSYQSQSDPVNPLASTRYLLDGDEPFLEQFPDLDVLPAWRRIDSERFRSVTGDDSPSLKPSSSSSASSSFSSSVAAAPPVRCPTAEENDFAAGRTSPLGKSPEQRGPLLNESSPSPETTTTTTTTLPPTKETNSSTASREEQVHTPPPLLNNGNTSEPAADGITASITINSWFGSSFAGCRLEGFSPLQGLRGEGEAAHRPHGR